MRLRHSSSPQSRSPPSGYPMGRTGGHVKVQMTTRRTKVTGLAHVAVMIKWSTAICWTLILLAAIFFEGISGKGGRGGARGAARGSARGTTRRSKSSPRYSSSGTSLRVAAAAAGGAAAGASAAVAARNMRLAGEGAPEMQSGNSTFEGNYNYRAWTSGAEPWHLVYLPACLLCVASVFSI